MKIKYVSLSSNANPEYLDFWPCVARAWQKLGITPVLFFIPDRAGFEPEEVPDAHVHVVPWLRDVNRVLQASMVRFWGSGLYPDDVVMVSDLDILPLSEEFFVHQLADVPDDRYVHLRHIGGGYKTCDLLNMPGRVAEIRGMRYVTACYHIARGGLMSEVWGFDADDWEASCKRTVPYHYFRGEYSSMTFTLKEELGTRWYNRWGDELYSSACMHLFPRQDVFRFITYSRKQFASLLRWYWQYKTDELRRSYYSAAHLPRPWKEHEPVIRALERNEEMPLVYRACYKTVSSIHACRRYWGLWLSYILIRAALPGFRIAHRRFGWCSASLLWLNALEYCVIIRRESAGLTWLHRRRQRFRRRSEPPAD